MIFSYSVSSTPMKFTPSDEITRYINSLANLKIGWDFGSGYPITSYVINRALNAYMSLNDSTFSVECSPLSNDTIQLTFGLEDNFLDVIVSKFEYSVVREKGIGYDYEVVEEIENISLNKIKYLLEQIKTQCFLSEPLILQGIAKVKKDSKTVSPIWGEGSLFSKKNVLSTNPIQFAITSENTMVLPLECP